MRGRRSRPTAPHRSHRQARHLGWLRIAGVVAAIACALGLFAVSWWQIPRLLTAVRAHPYFSVSEMAVRGTTRLTHAQLLRWAGLHPGVSIWDVGPTEIRDRLLQHPDLADVAVRRDFPRRVVITVHERTPLAIAVLDDLYFVDRTGHVMDRLRDRDSRDLPLITGLRSCKLDQGRLLLLRRAARLIRLCQREGCGDGVSEVHVDARRGVTLVPLRRPVAIVLGWGAWRAKLARAMRVLAAWEGQESRLALLDASVPNQVIVRLRESNAGRIKRRATKPGVRT
jgi:cell division protein FtsQ